jgi:cell division protein ZapE
MEGLRIQDRDIPTVAVTDSAAWFEFQNLCEAPRGKGDYVELAHRFNTVMISDIPQLHAHPDQLKRLISLVDEFYDRNVKLVISAASPPQTLYTGKRLRREYARTASRLIEMQSQHYLARPHQPGGHSQTRLASISWLHRSESIT